MNMFLHKIRSRRGAALESAIMFMMVLSLFSMLLSSFVVIRTRQGRVDQLYTQSRLDLDDIGNAFVKFVKSEGHSTKNADSFKGTREGANSGIEYLYKASSGTEFATLYVYNKNDVKTVLLCVKVHESSGDITVTEWSYGSSDKK